MAHVPSRVRKKVEWLLRRAEAALLPERVLSAEGSHLDPRGALFKLPEAQEDAAELGLAARVDPLRQVIAGEQTSYPQHAASTWNNTESLEFNGSTPRVAHESWAPTVESSPRHINNICQLIEAGSVILF
jgi:hypothetical protein